MTSPALHDQLKEFPWLERFRAPGCSGEFIIVEFRAPLFADGAPRIAKEKVWLRIDAAEGRMFRCTIVCQPEQDWKLNEGDEVLVERSFFEGVWHLVCRTIQDTMGFDWQ